MKWWTRLRIAVFGLTPEEEAKKLDSFVKAMSEAAAARIEEDYQDELSLCREFGGSHCNIRCLRTPCPNRECPHPRNSQWDRAVATDAELIAIGRAAVELARKKI